MTEEQKIKRRAYHRAYYRANHERLLEQMHSRWVRNSGGVQETKREWNRNHPRVGEQKERQKAYDRGYRKANRERIGQVNKNWRLKNPEKVKSFWKTDSIKNREKRIQRSRHYYARHRTDLLEQKKEYLIKNREKINARGRKQYRENPVFNIRSKISTQIRREIRQAYKGGKKQKSTIQFLGCSFLELKSHIENQFKPGMVWELVMTGKIHLDHIRPCASFDLADLEQQKICFHYTNLQPLWAKDNLSKGAKWQAVS